MVESNKIFVIGRNMFVNQKSSLRIILSITIAAAALLLGWILLQPGREAHSASAAATFSIQLPLLLKPPSVLNVQGFAASLADANGNNRIAFMPGEQMRYTASGTNVSSISGTLQLSWTQGSACSSTQVFSQTLALPPGAWTHVYTTTVPNCPGRITHTAVITDAFLGASVSLPTVVNPPSIVAVDTRQGFDRCTLPSISQMQAWWDSSPYAVHNMYLGGESFFCDQNPLDAYWVQDVARQGWSFILAWVGPQAPCSGYNHRMSSNAATAYQEGRAEASSAASAAGRLGFLGDRIIYYDLEYYAGSNVTAACRNTVKSFIQGWTDKLHQLGYQAGAYGSPCGSYIADWWSNNPPPDDIWFAKWMTDPEYDPGASVWGDPVCSFTNAMWPGQTRLRQYAGDHYETWGGVRLGIDSNVLNGEITVLPTSGFTTTAQAAQALAPGAVAPLRDFGMLNAEAGWALQGNRLLWTADTGQSWQEVTPAGTSSLEILAAHFADARSGWLVSRAMLPDGQDALSILRTVDGGASWEISALPEASRKPGIPASAAYLDFVDQQVGFLAVKLQSGSSFSLGRLYFTQDGGRTWEERSLPLGEAVRFTDSLHGWVSGGPDGEQRYATSDGGLTWQPLVDGLLTSAPNDARLGNLEGAIASEFVSQQIGWALVQQGICQGTKTRLGESLPPGAQPLSCTQVSRLMVTLDSGQSWAEITPLLP